MFVILIFTFFLTIIFLLTFLLFRKDILSPSKVIVFSFLISDLCMLFNYNNWVFDFSVFPIFVLISGLLVIVFTELFVKTMFYKKEKEINVVSEYKKQKFVSYSKKNFVFWSIYVCDILCFLLLYYEIKKMGQQFDLNDGSFIGQIKENGLFSKNRWALLSFDVVYYLGYVFSYLLAKEFFNLNKKKSILILLLFPFFLSCLSVILRGSRSSILSLICSFFVFFISNYRRFNKIVKFKPKKILFMSCVISLAFILFFYNINGIVKMNKSDSSMIEYVTFYVGSPIYLFCIAVDNNFVAYSGYNYFGITTFNGIYSSLNQFNLLSHNISSSASGMLNFVVGMKTNGETFSGNALTVFYNPYYDFGYFGMLLYIYIFTLIFCLIYYKCLKYNKRYSTMWTIVYGYLFNYLIFSFYFCPTSVRFRPQDFIILLILLMTYGIYSNSYSKRNILFTHYRFKLR